MDNSSYSDSEALALAVAKYTMGDDSLDELESYLLPLVGKTRTRQLLDRVESVRTNEEHEEHVAELRRQRRAGPVREDVTELKKRIAELERLARANEELLAAFRDEQREKGRKKKGEGEGEKS